MKNKNQDNQVSFLCLSDIEKNFGPTKALQKMNLDIYAGKITGLIGANGAGKSTLIKVITGVHQIDGGDIVFYGSEKVDKKYSPNLAKANGIACAYQELSLCTNLKIYENFMVNHMDHKPFAKFGWRKRAIESTQKYIDSIFKDSCIDVTKTVSDLSLAEKQMVEIARAMSIDNLKLLILDEPTSSLTTDCIDHLHESMRKLADKGVAIVYITHKLNEIDQICDFVTVMKSGAVSWQGKREDTSSNELLTILGGRVESSKKTTGKKNDLPIVANIDGLNTRVLKDININVRKGEMIGISGLAGSGQKELLIEIFEASQKKNKKNIELSAGVAYVSGDRQNEGIFRLWNIADNINISSLDKVTKTGIIRRNKFVELAKKWYGKLKFTAEGIRADITSLSGGNQQKALIARGLATEADLILLNDPTCGVDIETKQEIYKLLEEAKNNGKSIILHSTEDMEMEQCDRVYVMNEGKVIAELADEEISVNNIIVTSFKEKSTGKTDKKEVVKKKSVVKTKIMGAIKSRSLLAFITLATIFIIISSLRPVILSYGGLSLLYSSAIPLVFIALGQMFLVISGGIDLGNGMSLGLMNVIVALIVYNNPGLGLILIILFILAYAGIGAIIHFTKIPAIVVTLGASFIWLGIALIVAPTPGGLSPEWLTAIYKFKFPIIPMPIVIAIMAALVSYLIVKKSKYGMIINGMGNNPAAISRAGWSQLVAVMVTYALSGVMVVFGGLTLTAISNSGDCNAAASYQMMSIATIILGGCEFSGGIGQPVGVVAAALAISSISALLTFIGFDSNLQSAVTGLILIVALAIKLASKKLEARI